jgi:hypothetical protein
MADIEEDALAVLAYTSLVDGDYFRIIDTSSGESKIVTMLGMKQYILGASYAINWADVSGKKELVTWIIDLSDESTAITTGNDKFKTRIPFEFTLTAVRLNCTVAPTGAAITVDMLESGVTVFSTKATVAAGSKTSVGGTPAVISDANLGDDNELSFNFDTVGSGVAGKGVKIHLYGYRMIDGL